MSIVLLCGCPSDEEPAAGSGGAAGMGAGAGAAGGGMGGTPTTPDQCDVPIINEPPCINTGEDNIECSASDALQPFTGSCAPKGPSCHRSSNRAKECFLGPDEEHVMEFRVTSSIPTNMPKSSGLPAFEASAVDRAKRCDSEQCLLMRTSEPRAGGQRIAGQGTTTIGVGKYNCDGTYSFYGDTAAPERPEVGRTGVGRWAPKPVMTQIDPTMEGRARSKVLGLSPARYPTCSAFYVPAKEEIDWEICTQGFDLIEFDTSEESRDGSGGQVGGVWDRPGRYDTYAPVALNDADVIDPIGITFCQLLSFGPLAPDLRATVTCKDTPRCVPGSSADCKYVKLPDSLCPTEAEAMMFGCHLGVKENINAEEGYPTDVNCTDTAPTSPLEDGQGGQCCDPLGVSTTLPACNSFRIVNSYAAAAVEITTDPSNTLQPVCQ